MKEWESACPMPNTKTLEEKVRTKLEKYFTRKKKLNQNQKISFSQIHMDMVRESVDFDDIFQYQPGTRFRAQRFFDQNNCFLKRPKADNPYETRSMPIQTRVPILDRILFVIVMQDKENYRYDGSTDADVTKINKRKHER